MVRSRVTTRGMRGNVAFEADNLGKNPSYFCGQLFQENGTSSILKLPDSESESYYGMAFPFDYGTLLHQLSKTARRDGCGSAYFGFLCPSEAHV